MLQRQKHDIADDLEAWSLPPSGAVIGSQKAKGKAKSGPEVKRILEGHHPDLLIL